jgi:hypothetical protein
MIQKLKIQNFQAHKDLELELKPGINLILGDSNVGKTSVIRALQLLLTGNPKTPIYASGNPVKVEMTLNDKVYSITKTIKKDKVVKTIWNIDGQEYDGANFKPDIGFSEINVQSQFEPFYMLSKTPGQIGKEIQFVTGIDLADEIKSGLNSEINVLKSDITKLKNSIEDDEKELSEYPDLKTIKKYVYKYESTIEKKEKKKEKFKKISVLSEKYTILQIDILESKKLVVHLESIKDRTEKYEQELFKINVEKEQKQVIIELIEKAIDFKNGILCVKNRISRLEKIKVSIFKCENELIGIRKEKKEEQDIIRLIKEAIRIKKIVKKLESRIKKMKKQYQKELGDICPTCGSDINIEKLERIL